MDPASQSGLITNLKPINRMSCRMHLINFNKLNVFAEELPSSLGGKNHDVMTVSANSLIIERAADGHPTAGPINPEQTASIITQCVCRNLLASTFGSSARCRDTHTGANSCILKHIITRTVTVSNLTNRGYYQRERSIGANSINVEDQIFLISVLVSQIKVNLKVL